MRFENEQKCMSVSSKPHCFELSIEMTLKTLTEIV